MYEVCVTFYMRVKQVITAFSKGYSQVLLQNNVVSGLFFFLATGIASFKEGANKRGNSSRLTQSFHFFMFEPIFSPVNALNQPI